MTARIKDLNEAFYGLEPTVIALDNTYDTTLSSAINWYSYNSDYDKRKQWTIDFLTQNNYSKDTIDRVNKASKFKFVTCAYLARILSNGGVISSAHKVKLNDFIQSLVPEIIEDSEPEKKEKQSKPKRDVISQVNLAKNEIDIAYDKSVISCDSNPNEIISKLVSMSLKPSECFELIDYCNKYISELEDFKHNKTEYVQHPRWTAILSNRRIKYFAAIIQFLDSASVKEKPVRKTTKKNKPATDTFKKFKCVRNYLEFGLTSISLDKILSASELWIYDIEHRQLIKLVAESKFTVRGTTIEGIKESGSFRKTLRKPKEQLTEFMRHGKVSVMKYVDSIKSVKNESVTGRMSETKIILRAF